MTGNMKSEISVVCLDESKNLFAEVFNMKKFSFVSPKFER